MPPRYATAPLGAMSPDIEMCGSEPSNGEFPEWLNALDTIADLAPHRNQVVGRRPHLARHRILHRISRMDANFFQGNGFRPGRFDFPSPACR